MSKPKWLLKATPWNKCDHPETPYRVIVSQRYYLWMIEEYYPHCLETFQQCIWAMESNAQNNKYKGWRSLAYEWMEFLNALTHESKSMKYYKLAKMWIDSLDHEAFALHFRATLICCDMMDNVSFNEALKMWEDLHQSDEDFQEMHGGYIFTKPHILELIEEDFGYDPQDAIKIDNAAFKRLIKKKSSVQDMSVTMMKRLGSTGTSDN